MVTPGRIVLIESGRRGVLQTGRVGLHSTIPCPECCGPPEGYFCPANPGAGPYSALVSFADMGGPQPEPFPSEPPPGEILTLQWDTTFAQAPGFFPAPAGGAVMFWKLYPMIQPGGVNFDFKPGGPQEFNDFGVLPVWDSGSNAIAIGAVDGDGTGIGIPSSASVFWGYSYTLGQWVQISYQGFITGCTMTAQLWAQNQPSVPGWPEGPFVEEMEGLVWWGENFFTGPPFAGDPYNLDLQAAPPGPPPPP